jgi:predicted enzyme related to lactoylglutathione lyase
MPRVIHCELPAKNPDKLVEFYRQVFNWTIEKWEGPVDYWLIITGPETEPGINGAIARTRDMIVSVPVVTLSVPSVDAFLTRDAEAGGKTIQEKRAIPGLGYHAYCQDPEGTVFGVMENDPSVH